jgi:membrane-bound metal-dependent hydrolase YbcI (DUF457 family)
MLLFAHLGITLGTAAIAAGVNSAVHKETRQDDNQAADTHNSTILYRLKSIAATIGSCFKILSRKIDSRAILIGAVLPDIIDKTIGHVILAGVLDNGRIFAHSLLFLLLVTITGVLVNSYSHNKFVLFMAYGLLMHLILDSMWLNPHTLFWPLLGITFEPGEPGNYLLYMLNSLGGLNVLIPEIIGFLVIASYGIWVISKKRVLSLIKYGKFEV